MKYRLRVVGGGFQGYVVIEEKRLFWHRVSEFSFFVYGTKRAFDKANELKKLLEENAS